MKLKEIWKKVWAAVVAVALFFSMIFSAFGHDVIRVPTQRIRREEAQQKEN